jgi:uncharacterized BrkB/YihY/UPF0761 family membrane protein
MKKFDLYITFIFIIKIGFLLTNVLHVYLTAKGQANSDLGKKLFYWKERLEFIFIALMSFLLIYLFNPRQNRLAMIDYETGLLLYLFGFVLIITAKWDVFFKESPFMKMLQKSVGNSGSR